MTVIRKLSDLLDIVCVWIMCASLVVMTICLVFLIFGRNLFGVAFASLEEISRFTLVWVTIIGGAVAFKRSEHMAFDFLMVRLPRGLQRTVGVIREVLLLALIGVMFTCGIELVSANIDQVSMQAFIPMGYVYVVFPIAGLVMFVHGLSHIISQFRNEANNVGDRIVID